MGPQVFVALSLAIMLLVGCATPYQPMGARGGFEETRLDESAWTVRFEGNGFLSRAAASDYALRRAAELSLEHGFSYFMVLERDEYVSTTTRTTPTQTTTTSAATAYGTQTATGYGTAHAYGSTTTTTTGGEIHTINHPRSVLTIRCYKDRPDVPGIVYNAEMVLQP